tara:strand:- start:16121 stop:16576 length:456 start_codon:yes stop_codon:yes gene_type:complete
MTDEMISEKELAHRLGVTRNVLRSHRETDLVKNADWKKNGRVIEYTSAGVESLMKLLGVEGAKNEKNGVSERSRPKEMLVLVAEGFHPRRFANSKMLPTVTKSGEAVWVRVKDNKNFRAIDYRRERMELPVVWDGRVWVLNRPCPRWLGKW